MDYHQTFVSSASWVYEGFSIKGEGKSMTKHYANMWTGSVAA